MTAKNTHIVREFDTPLTVDEIAPTRPANAGDGQVLVEDSVTHQAGVGITAGFSESMETPDIFENKAQAVVKPQTADQELVEDVAVPVAPVGATPQTDSDRPPIVNVEPVSKPVDNSGANTTLGTLPDGSVDVARR